VFICYLFHFYFNCLILYVLACILTSTKHCEKYKNLGPAGVVLNAVLEQCLSGDGFILTKTENCSHLFLCVVVL
jgi:hypothetical protein